MFNSVPNTTTSLITDSQGLILEKTIQTGGKTTQQDYVYVNGQNIANFGTIDTDPQFSPDLQITPTTAGVAPGTYVVHSGDTLQSIAQTTYGNSSLWYLIAEANDLSANATLTANQTLIIPNLVTNNYNNANTVTPYNPQAILGSTTPTLPSPPAPPTPMCNKYIATTIAIIVTIIVTICTDGAGTDETWVGMMEAMGAAMAGAVAGQTVMIVAGYQNGYNWKQIAIAGISAGLTQGAVGAVTAASAGSAVAAAVERALVSNLITQGVDITLHQQRSFSWTEVAASGLAAAANVGVDNMMAGNAPTLQTNADGETSITNPGSGTQSTDFGTQLASLATQSLVNATINVALSHWGYRRGKMDWIQVAGDAFGETLGNQLNAAIEINSQDFAAETAGNTAKAQYMAAELRGNARETVFGASADYEIDRQSQPDFSNITGVIGEPLHKTPEWLSAYEQQRADIQAAADQAGQCTPSNSENTLILPSAQEHQDSLATSSPDYQWQVVGDNIPNSIQPQSDSAGEQLSLHDRLGAAATLFNQAQVTIGTGQGNNLAEVSRTIMGTGASAHDIAMMNMVLMSMNRGIDPSDLWNGDVINTPTSGNDIKISAEAAQGYFENAQQVTLAQQRHDTVPETFPWQVADPKAPGIPATFAWQTAESPFTQARFMQAQANVDPNWTPPAWFASASIEAQTIALEANRVTGTNWQQAADETSNWVAPLAAAGGRLEQRAAGAMQFFSHLAGVDTRSIDSNVADLQVQNSALAEAHPIGATLGSFVADATVSTGAIFLGGGFTVVNSGLVGAAMGATNGVTVPNDGSYFAQEGKQIAIGGVVGMAAVGAGPALNWAVRNSSFLNSGVQSLLLYDVGAATSNALQDAGTSVSRLFSGSPSGAAGFNTADGVITNAADGVVTNAADGVVTNAADGVITNAADGVVTNAADGVVTTTADSGAVRPQWKTPTITSYSISGNTGSTAADTGSAGKAHFKFDNIDEFNRAVNNAASNTKYTYGDYSFTTDANGRLDTIEGQASLNDHRRYVTPGEPGTTAIGNEGGFEDVGFHAIGNQFDGPINRLNVFPGSGRSITTSDGELLKNLNLSRYKVDFENPLAGLIEETGESVPIRFKAFYEDGNLTARPDSFRASYQTPDGEWTHVPFVNRAGG